MTASDSESTGRTNKVDAVIEKYDLAGMAQELEDRWLSAGDEGKSTRELADHLNRDVLRVAVEDSDVFTLSGDLEQVYRSLTEDDADATLVRSRLEQNGVDVEAVVADFVSHQTVYRYLKNERGVEQPDQTAEERKQNAIDSIQRLRGRTTAVTERTIERLGKDDSISVGDFSVLNDLQVLCENCGRSYDVVSFLEGGGCDCEAH